MCDAECKSGFCGDGKCTLGIRIPSLLPGVGSFLELVENVIDFFFWVSIVLGTLVAATTALLIVVGSDNENKIAKLKKMLFWIVIGLGIVLLAKGIFAAIEGLFME